MPLNDVIFFYVILLLPLMRSISALGMKLKKKQFALPSWYGNGYFHYTYCTTGTLFIHLFPPTPTAIFVTSAVFVFFLPSLFISSKSPFPYLDGNVSRFFMNVLIFWKSELIYHASKATFSSYSSSSFQIFVNVSATYINCTLVLSLLLTYFCEPGM